MKKQLLATMIVSAISAPSLATLNQPTAEFKEKYDPVVMELNDRFLQKDLDRISQSIINSHKSLNNAIDFSFSTRDKVLRDDQKRDIDAQLGTLYNHEKDLQDLFEKVYTEQGKYSVEQKMKLYDLSEAFHNILDEDNEKLIKLEKERNLDFKEIRRKVLIDPVMSWEDTLELLTSTDDDMSETGPRPIDSDEDLAPGETAEPIPILGSDDDPFYDSESSSTDLSSDDDSEYSSDDDSVFEPTPTRPSNYDVVDDDVYEEINVNIPSDDEYAFEMAENFRRSARDTTSTTSTSLSSLPSSVIIEPPRPVGSARAIGKKADQAIEQAIFKNAHDISMQELKVNNLMNSISLNAHDAEVNAKNIADNTLNIAYQNIHIKYNTNLIKEQHLDIVGNVLAIFENKVNIQNLRESFDGFAKDFATYKKSTNGAIAGIAAMSQLPSVSEVGKKELAGGIGNHNGVQSLSAGIGYRVNSHVNTKASISSSTKHYKPMIGAGMSYER